ncbi:MAG: hypothetical protein ACYCXP_13600 [Leptospirillum sp.]
MKNAGEARWVKSVQSPKFFSYVIKEKDLCRIGRNGSKKIQDRTTFSEQDYGMGTLLLRTATSDEQPSRGNNQNTPGNFRARKSL